MYFYTIFKLKKDFGGGFIWFTYTDFFLFFKSKLKKSLGYPFGSYPELFEEENGTKPFYFLL